MTNQTKSNLRRFFSLTAFTALVAAITMAFASAPEARTEMRFDEFELAPMIMPTAIAEPIQVTPLIETGERAVPNKAKTTTKNKTKGALSGTLNINTATAKELVKLPGIGPKKAEKIIHWRAAHGKFGRVVDLRRVKGFGAKSVRKLMPYLSIKGPNTLE
ncbi:MAG: ComEA family DNA-binding protein [Myxococcales bacterium]|nr:ComEA family DNA-binding protein [Myxococcales bacterium]